MARTNSKPPKESTVIHSSERFHLEVIERSQIDFAPYNPRTITDQAKNRLRAAIEKVGMLGPITWNRTTGRVVSGHQRLRAMDAINGSKNYQLTVAAVELAEADEKAANILMNNPEAQGEWDLEELGKLMKEPDLDLAAAGLGAADVYKLIGDDADADVLREVDERAAEAKKLDKEIAEKGRDAAAYEWDYYFVTVFKNHEQRKAFADRYGLEDNRYISGEDLENILRTK